MNCPICEQPFNLASRQPVIMTCGDTVCSKCQIELINSPQNGTFDCPVCKKTLKCDTEVIPNKFAIEMIKKAQKINIYCHHHPYKQAKYFCKTHIAMICSQCGIETHGDHRLDLFKLKRDELDQYNKKIHAKLTVEGKRICNLIKDIDSYQENDRKFTSEQYISMIAEAKETLGYRLKTEEEKKSLNFIVDMQENIPAQIIPRQSSLECNDGVKGTLISENDMPLIKQWIGDENIKLQIIYRASVDGFTAKRFHDKCLNQGPTISIIQSDLQNIFGGYTTIPWAYSGGQHVKDEAAFIFSLTHQTKHLQFQDYQYAVFQNSSHLQCFGSVQDILIADNCNQNTSSRSNLGFVYKPPEGLKSDTKESQSYLAGQQAFKVIENEVYKVIKI